MFFFNFSGTCLNFTLILTFAICSKFFSLNPWIYVIASLPYSLVGANAVMLTVVYSYISDITTPENRSIRGGIFQLVFFGSAILGANLCGYLAKTVDNVWTFTLATTFAYMGLFLISCFLEESVDVKANARRSLLSVQPFKDVYNTAIQSRDEGHRLILWLSVLALCCYSFSFNGIENIFYLYVREQFRWDAQNFTTFISFTLVITGFGGFLSLLTFRRAFKASDALISTFAFSSSVISSVIFAFAQTTWHAYVATSIGFIRSVSFTTCRSILANISSDQDLGKINALIASFESIFNLIAAPLYTALYTSTLESFPGAFNLLSAAVQFMAVCLVL